MEILCSSVTRGGLMCTAVVHTHKQQQEEEKSKRIIDLLDVLDDRAVHLLLLLAPPLSRSLT